MEDQPPFYFESREQVLKDYGDDFLSSVPVFKPTFAEFKDFYTYLQSIEKYGWSFGACKIIAPQEWRDHPLTFSYGKHVNNWIIPNPIKQQIKQSSRIRGVYDVLNMVKKPISVKAFRLSAQPPASQPKKPAASLPSPPSSSSSPSPTTSRPQTRTSRSRQQISDPTAEDEYWDRITYSTPMYGADMPGTLFCQPLPNAAEGHPNLWNIYRLDSLLSRVLKEELEGITHGYLYFGAWRTSFAWHIEDMNLFSINYLHLGSTKQWWCLPTVLAPKFEYLAKHVFSSSTWQCTEHLRHKTTLIRPSLLVEHGITPHRIFQRPGDFIITFPKAYHCGFNHGYNIAESVNFALPSWIPYGLQAKTCQCQPDNCHIDMRSFLPSPQGTVESSSSDEELANELSPDSVDCTQSEESVARLDSAISHKLKSRTLSRLFIRAYDLLINPTEPVDYSKIFSDSSFI